MTDTNATVELGSNDRPHHPFSPSKLQSLEACPCFKGRDGTNEAAQRGTLQHKATETREDIAALDDTEAAAVAECIDFIDQRKVAMEEARAAAGENAPPVIELVEDYLPIDDEWIEHWDEAAKAFVRTRGTTAGYIDRAIISHDRAVAEIVDFKFGRWAIEKAENNLQGIAYALGLRKMFPTLQKVRVYFKLPHQDHLDMHEFDLERDGAALYLRVKTVVARAVECTIAPTDFQRAVPTIPTCLFCARLGRCDVVAAEMLKLAHKFAPLQVPADVTPSRLRGKEDAAVALRCASVAKAWGEALRQTIGNAVISGSMNLPPGFKIESRDGNRKVCDVSKFAGIARQHGVPQEVLDRATDMSIGPIEDNIKERAPRGSKKLAVESFATEIEQTGAIERNQPYSFLKAIPSPANN